MRATLAACALLLTVTSSCDGSSSVATDGAVDARSDAPLVDDLADASDAAHTTDAVADAPALDRVEPAPGTPGGACADDAGCPAQTWCRGSRCAYCGGVGETPCPGDVCREGVARFGMCYVEGRDAGTLGSRCRLDECEPEPGHCSVPDGLNFVCFACGEAAGQVCCPFVGCPGAGLRCDDGVCH